SGTDDTGVVLAVDGAGDVFVTGRTTSPDFPTTLDAISSTLGGTQDAYVAILDATGSALVYSTYLGGSGIDTERGMTLDGAGNVYLVGDTDSPDFPTVNAYQGALSGATDAFIVKIGG